MPGTKQIVTIAVTPTEVRAFLRNIGESLPDLADTILVGKVEKK